MPNVTIDGPKIEDVEVKRVLVNEITDALEKAYKILNSELSGRIIYKPFRFYSMLYRRVYALPLV